jgi:hypothetical protein
MATLWHDRDVPPTIPRGSGREPGPEDNPRESWQRRPRESGRGPRRPDEQGAYREPEGYGRREPGHRDDRPYPPPEGRTRAGRPERGAGNGRAEWHPEEDDRGGREGPPPRREPRDPRESRESRDPQKPREAREPREGREREPRDIREPRDPREPREGREPREPREPRRPAEPAERPSRLQRPRLRRPHNRRAVAGQQTGLDPDLQSDLPSWLQQRGVETAPVRRVLSLSVAMFSALLGFGLLLGAYTLPTSYSFVIFGVQFLFVLAWTVAMRPPGALIVGVVGIIAAAAADFAAVLPDDASLAPLGYVMVGGFILGVIGQLFRGAGRDGVTESLGATLAAVVGAVAFASLLVLNRHQLGTQSIVACLAAAAVALVVSRLSDTVLTTPRTSPEVPRGAIGVILGAMAGTAAAAVLGTQLVGLHPPRTAIAGLVTAMAAIMADLAVSYAEVSRELEGGSSLWVARHMQGPLGGFALAAPAAYVLSVMVLIPGF